MTFINPFEYSHINSSIKWVFHSLTQLLLHSFIHPNNFTSSLAHLINHTLTNLPTHSFTQTFACLLNYAPLRGIHTFYSFIHTSIQSLISKEIAHNKSLTHWIIHTSNQPSIGHDEGLRSRSVFFLWWISLIKELYLQWLIYLIHNELTLVSEFLLWGVNPLKIY